MLYDPIKVLSGIHNLLQDAVAATERMGELFASVPAIVSGEEILARVEKIEFRSVALDYGGVQALQGVDLDAHKGRVYALVGDSGGGKSSFINLLVRFYDATGGELLINGQDIRSYTLPSLHGKIAYVTQRIYIFQDTILANVAYGSEPDEQKAIAALKKRRLGSLSKICRMVSALYLMSSAPISAAGSVSG